MSQPTEDGADPKAANHIVRFAAGSGRGIDRIPRLLTLTLPPNNQNITEELAIDLRRVVFGQCPAMTRPEFFSQGPGLMFREANYPLAYGLTITNAATSPMMRALMMAIQAQVLKTLLFESASLKLPKNCDLLKPPSTTVQQDVLALALANMIWKMGNGKSATLCLPQPSTVHVKGSTKFNEDGLTEKLQICLFDKLDELNQTIRRNILVFQEDPGPGVMLVLYSAVLTRGIQQIYEDIGTTVESKCVMGNTGALSFVPLSLFLWGTASPYLHNGVQRVEDGKGSSIEQSGVLIRSPLGLLVWMGAEDKTALLNIGSRLKTPIVPVWLVICSEHSGVLFSDDKGLLRDYQAENRFQLHYYTSSHLQANPVILKINNRTKDESSDNPSHALEKVVRTKWSDARLDWGAVDPFV